MTGERSRWDADVPFNASPLTRRTRAPLPITFHLIFCSTHTRKRTTRFLIFPSCRLRRSSPPPPLCSFPRPAAHSPLRRSSLLFPSCFSPSPSTLTMSCCLLPSLPLGAEAIAECQGSSDHSAINHNWGWLVVGWDPCTGKAWLACLHWSWRSCLVFSLFFLPSLLFVCVRVRRCACALMCRKCSEPTGLWRAGLTLSSQSEDKTERNVAK